VKDRRSALKAIDQALHPHLVGIGYVRNRKIDRVGLVRERADGYKDCFLSEVGAWYGVHGGAYCVSVGTHVPSIARYLSLQGWIWPEARGLEVHFYLELQALQAPEKPWNLSLKIGWRFQPGADPVPIAEEVWQLYRARADAILLGITSPASALAAMQSHWRPMDSLYALAAMVQVGRAVEAAEIARLVMHDHERAMALGYRPCWPHQTWVWSVFEAIAEGRGG
jgi:hypothetical protein